LAKQKAAQIELDLSAGYFDATLLKYKPRILGKTATEISAVELFERFAEHKFRGQGVCARSIETRYKPLLRYWLKGH
jgi:integrase